MSLKLSAFKLSSHNHDNLPDVSTAAQACQSKHKQAAVAMAASQSFAAPVTMAPAAPLDASIAMASAAPLDASVAMAAAPAAVALRHPVHDHYQPRC